MIRVTLLYPRRSRGRFDYDYYLTNHMPWTAALLGRAIESIVVDRPVSAPPWPEPAYWAICSFTCDSREAYEAALAPCRDALQGDVAVFTDAEPIVQIGEIAFRAA